MKNEIEITYSFEVSADILQKDSEQLMQYEAYFDEQILPEIREVERRKVISRNKAYHMMVSAVQTETI
jgi:hypothetical protein